MPTWAALMFDIANLTVHYGKHRALDAVSLQVQPKELVVILEHQLE